MSWSIFEKYYPLALAKVGMQIFLFSLQIRKFLGSDLYRKYTYFLGVPVRNRKSEFFFTKGQRE